MERCPKCGVASEGMVLHDPHDAAPSSSEKRGEVQRTHWDDCWRDPRHHACAVAKIEQIERELAEAADTQRVQEAALRNCYTQIRELQSARAEIIEECAQVCEAMAKQQSEMAHGEMETYRKARAWDMALCGANIRALARRD